MPEWQFTSYRSGILTHGPEWQFNLITGGVFKLHRSIKVVGSEPVPDIHSKSKGLLGVAGRWRQEDDGGMV